MAEKNTFDFVNDSDDTRHVAARHKEVLSVSYFRAVTSQWTVHGVRPGWRGPLAHVPESGAVWDGPCSCSDGLGWACRPSGSLCLPRAPLTQFCRPYPWAPVGRHLGFPARLRRDFKSVRRGGSEPPAVCRGRRSDTNSCKHVLCGRWLCHLVFPWRAELPGSAAGI